MFWNVSVICWGFSIDCNGFFIVRIICIVLLENEEFIFKFIEILSK